MVDIHADAWKEYIALLDTSLPKEHVGSKDYIDTHVYVVFADGEIISTKAGDLLGMRGFHVQAWPWPNMDATDDGTSNLPYELAGYDCAFYADMESCMRVRKLIEILSRETI